VNRIAASKPEYFGAPDQLRQPSPAQARCDSIQAAFRAEKQRPSIRREPPPLPPALTPTEDQLMLRLAEELEYAQRTLELLGDALAADMALVMRHSVPLQSVDIIGQLLGHIADVVRSSDPGGAVDRIGMGDLKARLTRSSL
jgi:hypothetical protein